MLILIYIIFIILILVEVKRNILSNINSINIDNIYDIAKTGDLILFKWHSLNIVREFASYFSHVGMVIEIKNKKYILETHLKGDTKVFGNFPGGVNIYNLKHRIMNYEGFNYIIPIQNNLITKDKKKLLMKKLIDYFKIPFNDNYANYYTFYCVPKIICDVCIDDKIINNMFCSQFMANILKDLDILDRKFSTLCISPESLLYLKNKNGFKIYSDINYIYK